MPTAATCPTGKRSKRGRLSEGAPTKKTPEMISRISEAISLGLTDEETCNFVGIEPDTLVRWKKDPEFYGSIKGAIAARLVLRLKKIEAGADGWHGAAWLTERLLPLRYSKPELQLNLIQQNNTTLNALSITISEAEVREIEAEASTERKNVREMFARYRQGTVAYSDGENQRIVDVQADTVTDKPTETDEAVQERVREKFSKYKA